MKEYGGYIELEINRGPEYHPDALALNCGCSCVMYLAQAKAIQKLYLPAFMCSSVKDACERVGVQSEYYRVDENFRPQFPQCKEPGSWMYLVNFYGQITDQELLEYKRQFPNLIVDHAQDFFRKPLPGVDTLYSCRKFFGVADGAYLYTDVRLPQTPPLDVSYGRMEFLMGRFEKTANEFYAQYVANNDSFASEPVKQMSALTHNLLRGIDYGFVARRRRENFAYLHQRLQGINSLTLTIPEGAFMYPLKITGGTGLRKKLQARKIYIPTLWPDVFSVCKETDTEHDMAANILPLPVDQRYDREDMDEIIRAVLENMP